MCTCLMLAPGNVAMKHILLVMAVLPSNTIALAEAALPIMAADEELLTCPRHHVAAILVAILGPAVRDAAAL